jgi:hypothetical protein
MIAVTGQRIGCYTPQIILGAGGAWIQRLETTSGHTLFKCMKQIVALILSSSLDTLGNISKLSPL